MVSSQGIYTLFMCKPGKGIALSDLFQITVVRNTVYKLGVILLDEFNGHIKNHMVSRQYNYT
jgi:hypothetical protein